MQKLNDQFDEYRDCLRVVWNLVLRHRLKGTVSFPDVSQALLDALVLDDLRAATPSNTQRVMAPHLKGLGSIGGYIPALGVAISSPSPLLLRPKESGNAITYDAVEVSGSERCAPLYYVDVFDFRSDDQMFDFEYVEAVASANFGGVLQGDLILLRRSEIDIVDLTE